ncbi:MAG TPA: hypothetical protein VLT33_04380 [Labilithrix sp.]|nr:hypothetical protein [Labilithrix sp.]
MHRSSWSSCGALLLVLAAGGSLALACSTSPTAVEPGADDGGGGPGDPTADGAAPPPAACTKPADCPSRVCTAAGVCALPGPTDGVKNGDETDVDCGGTKAPKCDALKGCKVAADCSTGVCLDKGQGLLCQAPAPDDGAKNGDETDVDCGGTKAPKCATAKDCKVRGDCVSDVCTAGKCVAPAIDGVKNGTETDIDCGGSAAPRCTDLLGCKIADDCTSGVCTGLVCQVPTPTDGVKNGVETDVDCGGAGNPTCGTGKACAAHADCTSDGCAYTGKCADKRSCTSQYGGDTCGAGGAGGVGAASWESCCATATAGAGGVEMNKYQVTSGRMRAFLTRVNGNVRKVVQDARAGGQLHGATMDPSWDLYLPTSMIGCDQDGSCGATEVTDHFYQDNTDFQGIYTSAIRHVGGSIFNGQNLGQQGCRVDAPGAHSYWMDAATQSNYFGDMPAKQSQAVYDAKSLNCVDYLVAQSFCIWDGGRLETFAEWVATIPTAQPWGASPSMRGPGSASFFTNRFPTANDATTNPPSPAGTSIEYGVFLYSYEYPQLDGSGYDYIGFISAPGRTKGRTQWGHADIAGNLMEMTSDVTTASADPRVAKARWTSNGSFEGHGYSKGIQWNGFSLLNKYGKQGLRCVYP